MAYGIIISSDKSSGYVNDVVTLTATTGEFNSNIYNNIVTVNDITAIIVTGTPTQLVINIPYGATSGNIEVDVNYNNINISNPLSFDVLYKNETYSEISLNNKKFNNSYNIGAIYNRDLAYSAFTEVTDENSMVQNLYTILLTRVGERFFNSSFGSTIEYKLFNLNADYDSLESDILKDINVLIERYEPRIILIKEESFIVFNADANEANIILMIKVPSGNIRTISLTFKNTKSDI